MSGNRGSGTSSWSSGNPSSVFNAPAPIHYFTPQRLNLVTDPVFRILKYPAYICRLNQHFTTLKLTINFTNPVIMSLTFQ